MLAEWLEGVWSGCPPHLREMGYLREMLGIRRRYRRYRRAWQPHCQRSRQLLLAAVARCRQHRRAVVLGSGWLHDVPLEELSRQFASVVLVDLFHPLAARWRVRRYPNVRLLAADVTGTLEGVWQAAETPGAPLPRATPTLFCDEADLDLTISLNLLSQLPCMPEQYLRQAGRGEREILDYCRGLVEAHLAYLQRLPGVVALLADVEVQTVNHGGAAVRRESTLYGVEFPFVGESWTWSLVPRRPLFPHHAEVLTVVGVEDVKTAIRR